MSLRSRLKLATEVFRNGISSSHELMQYLISRQGYATDAGVDVSPESAMRLAAAYSCVRVVSEDMAKLPLKLMRRTEKGRERADDHPMAKLLRNPNPWQTDFEFREMAQAHIELAGMFFALKTIVRGEVRELLPLAPYRMIVEQNKNWTLKFTITWPDGMQEPIDPKRVLFLRGLSLDGYTGVSPVRYQAETMGLAMALVKFGSKLFKNGANVGGILEHPGTMGQVAWERLKQSFAENYASLDNSHKTLLLEEGAKFSKTGMAAEEAQFLESRKLSRSEIAGIYRVPPHKIGDLERSTFSNIEHQSIDYATDALMPRSVRLERSLARQLLSEDEQQTMYFKHDLNALVRGDFATRMKGYQTAILSGWLNRNEVRELEDLNPGPAELDEYLTPVNMQIAGEEPDEKDTNADPNQRPNQPPRPPKREE